MNSNGRHHRPAGSWLAVLLVLAVGVGLTTSGASGTAPDVGEERTIIVGGDPFCPINCAEDDGVEGYNVDITRAIFEPLGFRVVYRTIPWARAVSEGEAGRLHAIVGASPGKAGFIYPSRSAGVAKFIFMYRRSEPFVFTGLSSLEGRTIGVVQGYHIDGPVGRYIEEHQNDPSRISLCTGERAGEMNIRKLAGGRVDMIIDNESTLMHLVRTLNLDGLAFGAPVGGPWRIYVAFSKARAETPELVRLWDEGMDRLRTTGELVRIMQRYGLGDWEPLEEPFH